MLNKQCIVNSKDDLYALYEAREFIDKQCSIIKKTKSGLIQVSLNSNPKKLLSVSQKNITLSKNAYVP
jgi:hypothetical protein